MNKFMRLVSFLFFSLVALGFAVSFAEASGPFTVYASVASGSGAVQAQLVPGEFTVPQGNTAVIVKFAHDDPKIGRASCRDRVSHGV